MGKNSNLAAAKKAKKDEFYTWLTDIEKEMKNYFEVRIGSNGEEEIYNNKFEGKHVFCNCDDPYESNFFKYFALNFNRLRLTKLTTTCWKWSPIATRAGIKPPYKAVMTHASLGPDGSFSDADVNAMIESGEIQIESLKDDGDFKSKECLDLLDDAHIVCTNPPFSLFREYVSLLVNKKKDFIIIGNINAVTYKDFFKLLQEGRVWIGESIHSGDRAFYVPNDYPLQAAGCGIDESTGRTRKFIRVKGVRWFTNLYVKRFNEKLTLVHHYSPERYPKYDNYDAIEVGHVKDIPCDWGGLIGVPITFLDKYNPNQFEIIGSDTDFAEPIQLEDGKTGSGRFYVNGRRLYSRILIRNKHPEKPEEVT